MKDRLNIEMVLPALPAAGMETIVAELGMRLKALGYGVGFTCIHGRGVLAARLEEAGIRVSYLPLIGKRGNLIARPMQLHLARVQPDVVHSHSGAWHQTVLPARRAGIRAAVHTAHGLQEAGDRRRDRVLMRLSSYLTQRIVAVSVPLKDYLMNRVGAPPHRVCVVHNGVDTARFRPGQAGAGLREQLGIPTGAWIIGNVARLTDVKDHDTLLRAVSSLIRWGIDTHLVLAGDGPRRNAIEALASQLDITSRVHLLGVLTDPAPLYRDLDVFVLSSIAEGTSLSLLEAMSSGTPVVATDVGGNPDVVGVKAGVLVPPSQPDTLAQAIRQLVSDSTLRARYSRLGRKVVEERFSLDSMVAAYIAIYDSVTAVSPGG